MANEPVPAVVEHFVQFLYQHLREKNVAEVLELYEASFSKISARFFKASPWPSVHAISPLVDNDAIFCMLYSELYFRHVFSRLIPSLQQRVASWSNYSHLFSLVLNGSLNLQLPNQWLWEMVDEFTYQMQSFCHFKCKVHSKSDNELEQLKQHQSDGVWKVDSVLRYLEALRYHSDIINVLEDDYHGRNSFTVNEGYNRETSNVRTTLGYFSLVGLMKLYVLLGDYESALQAIDPLDLNRNGLFARVPGANATTLYYAGFSYLMLQRYTDAIRTFNNLLVGVARTKGMARSTITYEQMLRLNEQALALLAICLSICPNEHMVDETPLSQVKERHGDKMAKMAQGDGDAFEDVFASACPNFISASEPNLDDRNANLSQDAYLQQLRRFLNEIQTQQSLPLLRSYLRLFTSVRLPKLANMLETDAETLREQLYKLQERSTALEHPGGRSPIQGQRKNISSITIEIDGELLIIRQSEKQRSLSGYFMQQARRFQLMSTDVRAGADPNLTGSAVSG